MQCQGMNPTGKFVAKNAIYRLVPLDPVKPAKRRGNHHNLEMGFRSGRDIVIAALIYYLKVIRVEAGI